MNITVCIPTLNAHETAPQLIQSLSEQTQQPDSIIVIDSASDDDTREQFFAAGATVYTIERCNFNHGGTRQLVVEMVPNADLVIFLTQDAVLADRLALESLARCFRDRSIAAAFGRQLPRLGAGHIEAHARIFNYPGTSRVTGLDDRKTMGIKAAFISNSFAAYRRAELLAAGGFPTHLILGEDTYVAAKMLLAGKKIAYCAEATVYHSHDYGFAEEFRRYFDTGVLHAREPWIRARFGNAEGEGLRYIKSEMAYLWKKNPFLIPSSVLRTGCKYLGFRMGLRESLLPLWLKRRLSMFRGYWAS